jgi:PhnB protein
MAIEGSVPTPGVIVPHVVVADAATALAFYQRAFGAKVLFRSPSPSGEGEHIHVRVWDSLMQISTEEKGFRERKMEGHLLASPDSLGGATCVFQVGVADVDSSYKQAVDAGATPAMPPMDMFWGDRYGWVGDPFGHVWALCTVREILSVEEIEKRMRQFSQEAQ